MDTTYGPNVALVTGSTRGLGFATARLLGRKGVDVIVCGRNGKAAEDASGILQAEGLRCRALQLDITTSRSIAAAAAVVEQQSGRLDILVNNAGILIDHPDKQPSEQPLDIWRKTFETNLFGMIAVTRALLPLLKRARAGRIVNVSSSSASLALHGDPRSAVYDYKLPAYNASKSAINAWTVHLAHELRHTAIKVNAVDPGYTKTDMNGGLGFLEPEEGAETSVAMALADANGPTGGFFHRDRILPW